MYSSFTAIPYFYLDSFLAARAKNYYHLVGLVIGWSVLHGGPGGNFFSKTLFNSVAYGAGLKDVNMEDIADNEVLENLTKVLYHASVLMYIFFLFNNTNNNLIIGTCM